MSVSRKASILAFSLLLGSTSVLSPASAQILSGRITPGSGRGFTACLNMEGSRCRLIAPTVAIAIHVQNGDAVISYLDPAPGGYAVQRKDSVAQDLEIAISKGIYGNDQAAYIFAEMLSLNDLMYRLPADQTELRRAMGFPAQAVLTPEDQIGVLTSHLQITLGVTALTADYLVNKLGLKVMEDAAPQPPEPSPEAVATPPASAPTATPTPAPIPTEQPLEPSVEPPLEQPAEFSAELRSDIMT